ncbi:MAG: hypothetical protein K2K31_00480 [Clostridia bacterium]|nr:hypothetical protein [Clostridia bacterium]
MEHCNVHYDYINFIMNGGNLIQLINGLCQVGGSYNSAENFKFLNHDEIQICKGVVLPVSQILDIIGENGDSKFYWCAFDNLCFSEKISVWSQFSRKKFLPSWVVVKNFPQNEIANFYANNNCDRYKELIKCSALTNCKDQLTFEGQEGLFKMAYALGLFNESAKQSQKAFEYIKTHFLDGIDGNEEEGMKRGQMMHRLYGHMDLSKGFDKNFADFFMIHYALDKNAFVDPETGADMTAQIYREMDEILKFRPEKKIKTTTRNQILWPKDAIGVLRDARFAFGVDIKYPELGNQLLRYGGDLTQYQWAEPLYEEALKLNEEDLSIPTVVDKSDRTVKFKVLDKHDPKVFVVGEKSNCCFVYRGASERSLRNAVTSKDARIIEFEAERNYIQGWVWYDKEAKTVCIDNFEGRMDPEFEQEFVSAFMDFAQKTYFAMQKNPETPCKRVNLGIGSHICGAYNFDVKLLQSGEITRCQEPAQNYVEGLYTDAYSQYTLFDEEKANFKITTQQINK